MKFLKRKLADLFVRILDKKLVDLVIRILYEIFCLNEKGSESSFDWLRLSENIYIDRIRQRHKLVLDEKAVKTIEKYTDEFDRKYSNLLERTIIMERTLGFVNSESFIDGIVERINKKQVKK